MINLKEYDKETRSTLANVFYPILKQKYPNEIRYSVEHTTRYGKASSKMTIIGGGHDDMRVHLIDTDSVSCLFDYADEGGRTAVLNFASFKHPGGMFLNGSSAQEESLCHQSTLYPVLLEFMDSYYIPHKNGLRGGLYDDDILYSRDILFFDFTLDELPKESGNGSYMNYTLNRSRHADVITCAAPNARAYYRRMGKSNVPIIKFGTPNELFSADSETREILFNDLRARCDAVLSAAVLGGSENVILGAFGCGVFGNDPRVVADYFFELLFGKYKNQFKNVYFPIPKSSHDSNFEEFKYYSGVYNIHVVEKEASRNEYSGIYE